MKSSMSKSQGKNLDQMDPLTQAKIKYLEIHSGKSLNYFKSKVDLLYRQLKQADQILTSELTARLSEVNLTALLDNPEKIKRKQAYSIIASEHHFEDWPSFKHWIEQVASLDLARFFCRREFLGFTNHWYNSYGEAKHHQIKHGGVLLSYKLQFFVASKNYLEAMGFTAENECWKRMEFDWVNPREPAAKLKVVEQLIKRFVSVD
ncbi:MAG: hypothetical protein OQJ89_15245 [Kangiellaceae bacterium]|nr:hypothetical protein [Kangiellaceae bacterium]MCW8999164.1 hypothetical protein [Kangiellaceae bacterium]MCW9018326.1 hypothetical protein [Kangiellaceae bacterium]